MAKQEKPQSIGAINACPDCGSGNIIKNEEKQQIICKDCGLIYEPFAVMPDAKK